MQTRLAGTSQVLLLLILTFGCAQSPVDSLAPMTSPQHSGRVLGGQQPIANATVQLYAVGTSGDASKATPLLSKVVITDGLGNFDITGLYSCPKASKVYITASGGRPSPNSANQAIELITALGSCSSLTPETSIEINELTTVAAVNALSHFMRSPSEIGSSDDDAESLNTAFQLASQLVDAATGSAPGQSVPSGFMVPVEALNTLGNITSACVNSRGGVAGDGSPCGMFFALATPPHWSPPTNTLAALHNLALDPELNTNSLFGLISAQPAFQPDLSDPPSSFQISLIPVSSSGALMLSPSEISFPITPLESTSRIQTLILRNTGDGSAALSNIKLSGVDAGDFAETNDCPSSLSGGASCTIQATFTPWDTTQRTATLQINSDALRATFWGKSSLPTWQETVYSAHPSLYLNFNETGGDFLDHTSGTLFSSHGTIVSGMPGFDNTWSENKSAYFTAGSYMLANDPTAGDFEWNEPFSLLLHIDNLQYPLAGTTYLLSKGDVGGSYGASWYELAITMHQGIPQLCFTVSGAGAIVPPKNVRQSVCTRNWNYTIPNGYNYDIIATSDGTGSPNAFQLYLNGVNAGSVQINNSYHFGSVVVTVEGAGSGYAGSTAFTSVGGGANCVVQGTVSATNGLPTGVSYTKNWGCTSIPSVSFTTPAGTGATLQASLYGASLSTAKTNPLIVGGAQIQGTIQGMNVAEVQASPQRVDEVAIFPSTLSAKAIGTMYWETKFYQGLLDTAPATPKKVIFDNDGCVDTDNLYALALAIGADHFGYINLAGIVDTDANAASTAMYRQMLDQAGLKQIPVSVPSKFATTSNGICLPANIATFDKASGTTTSQDTATYPSAEAMYRTVLAANPNEPVFIVLGGSFRGLADLMQSGPDQISSMTGAELITRDAANGGGVFAQGLGANITFTGDNSLQDWTAGQYVVTHNGSLPIFWYGGQPQISGPGILTTRETMDPLSLMATSLGTDVRQAFDSLPTVALLSSFFARGMHVAISGTGTGYASDTLFTSSGGGSSCFVDGVMQSPDGIPANIEPQIPYGNQAYTGLGEGCGSVPQLSFTSPTGKGAALITTATAVCGTVEISGSHSGSTSTAKCSNHYFLPYSWAADQSNPQILQWFLNSVIDPPPGP